MNSWTVTACLLASLFATSGALQAETEFVDFKTMGTITTMTLDVGIMHLTGDDGVDPVPVTVLNLNGLGVLGGIDSQVDAVEAVHFQFDTLVNNVRYHAGQVSNLDGDGFLGEGTVEAFVGVTSLGVVPVDDWGWKNVSGMFGGAAITGFSVRADVDGVRIDAMDYVTHWDDLGNGLAGSQGVPNMTSEGWLTAGTSLTTQAGSLLPNTTATLIVGFTAINAPFKGGVLVPGVDLLVTGLPTGPNGRVSVSTIWPAGVPSDFQFYQQIWLADPAGVKGFAASNGLLGTTP
jgi:hypothetical protein